ncbi:phospholipase effector Tle1 domain-containing protein, partial [Bradyrhizobium sp.]|uniref:phospholipase effector Tle1 domain-containing protein n=1 Tax=Bradyrhizobium sp. TaxID=376 RepID=UPI003C73E168
QVWFAGVHSNIGGGYPDDSLAYIPFVWMITEARNCGLKFKSDAVKPPAPVADPDTFKNAISRRDKDGRIYDPRSGLGSYYRYGPRKLGQLCNARYTRKEDDEVVIARPKIHETVFRRIDNHAHAYAPAGLPPVYDVVRETDGAILTPSQFGVEEDDEAKARADAQEHVWNEIWKRRIVYFATVGATLWLLVFPLVSGAQRDDEFTSPIRWVSDLIRLVGGFLPGFASTWVNGYARAPGSFLLLAALVGGLMLWGMRIASRISVGMGTIWRGVPDAPSGLPNNFIYRLRSHPVYIALHERLKRRWAPAFFALLFVYLGFCLASHLLYNVQDVAGLTCMESASPKGLAKGETIAQPIEFKASDICKATGIKVEGNGARYYVKVEAMSSEPWSNWLGIPVPIGGFSSTAQPAWYHRLLLAPFVPLRRELTQDWFRIVLRYGGVGGEEDFIEPDPEDYIIETVIKPTRKGELFIFVNDAVIGIPGLYDWFYRKDRGAAKLTVTRR